MCGRLGSEVLKTNRSFDKFYCGELLCTYSVGVKGVIWKYVKSLVNIYFIIFYTFY